MSLTREEVVRRLVDHERRCQKFTTPDTHAIKQALQTALAAMDERDEAIQRGVSSAVALGKCQGERDALAAEGRLLRTVLDALDECHETWGKADPTALSSAAYVLRMSINRVWDWMMIQNLEEMEALSSTSLVDAEVERVRKLEDVLEAAKEHLATLYCPQDYRPTDRCDRDSEEGPCLVLNLCAAIAAHREGERPGGEVCHEKITAREKKGGD